MFSMNTINEFKKAISNGHVETVIKDLENYEFSESDRKYFDRLAGRYRRLERKELKGTISHENQKTDENQIVDNLLSFISNLGNNNVSKGKNIMKYIAVTIDTEKSTWQPYPSLDYAFFQSVDNSNRANRVLNFLIQNIILLKSQFPIFNFIFKNNSNQEIIFIKINLSMTSLAAGIHGIPDTQTYIMKPVALQEWSVLDGDNILTLPAPISVAPKSAFMYQVKLSEKSPNLYDQRKHFIEEKKALDFSFHFENDIVITTPTLYLNCKNERDRNRVQIVRLS